MPFVIGDAERDTWLTCMRQAAGETLPDSPERDRFLDAVTTLAGHMHNQ